MKANYLGRFKILKLGFLFFLPLLILSCKDSTSSLRTPAAKDKAPGKVRNTKVTNLAGGAKITYDLPVNNESLLYVKAVYSTNSTNEFTKKATYFKNSLTVDGFADTKSHKVKLYAVSRGENASDPVSVTIKPLTPPLQQVLSSINAKATFGGVQLDYTNQNQASVAVVVLAKDSTDQFVPALRYYSDKENAIFSVRGFEAKAQTFGYYVRDQFQNLSDTLFVKLKPFFEQDIDDQNFSNVKLPGDNWEPKFGNINNLFDDQIGTAFGGGASFFQSKTAELPQRITIDMGQTITISRFLMAGRPQFASYNRDYPQIFELWGSENPNPDGSYDSSWTKLGTFESMPPSGEDPPSQSDQNNPTLPGENFNIPNPANNPPIRYLRIRVIKTFQNIQQMSMSEIEVYGKPVGSTP